jgi:hypothetical protein
MFEYVRCSPHYFNSWFNNQWNYSSWKSCFFVDCGEPPIEAVDVLAHPQECSVQDPIDLLRNEETEEFQPIISKEKKKKKRKRLGWRIFIFLIFTILFKKPKINFENKINVIISQVIFEEKLDAIIKNHI